VIVSGRRIVNGTGWIGDRCGCLVRGGVGIRRSIVDVGAARTTGNERGGKERGSENADRNHGVGGCLELSAELCRTSLKRHKAAGLFK
jgi:hypothetical protein